MLTLSQYFKDLEKELHQIVKIMITYGKRFDDHDDLEDDAYKDCRKYLIENIMNCNYAKRSEKMMRYFLSLIHNI
jgi:hypothetical protein